MNDVFKDFEGMDSFINKINKIGIISYWIFVAKNSPYISQLFL